MVYEENLEVLKSKYHKIFEWINTGLDADVMYDISIESGRKDGQVVVCHMPERDIYLNSKYDPIHEANQYMSGYFDMPDESVLFMYGLSNTNYVRTFIQNTKKSVKCIVYEPSIDVFMQVIQNIDMKDILESDRVNLVVCGVNDEDFSFAVGSWLQIYNKDTNKIMAAPKYIDLFHDSYLLFTQSINDSYEKFYICVNTDLMNGKDFVINGVNNMVFLKGCRSGFDLCGKFPKEMPAVVVSAGPSLEKNINFLKEIKGKAFIFATDSSLRKVLEIGIKPDAMITIDPNKSVERFKADDIDDIPFFVEMYANTEILRRVKSKQMFFFSSDCVMWSELFEKAGSKIPNMGLGGSVATAAIANLIIWGFKRIILIGQDLAFTGNRMHAGEDAIEISENDNTYMKVKDIHGEDVIIRKDYYVYLKWIENIAGTYKDIDFIDATEGGTVKKNLKQMTFQEAIDMYCKDDYDNISDILASVPKLFDGKDAKLIMDAFLQMKHDFECMIEQLLVCRDDCIKGKEILTSNRIDIEQLKRINESIKKTDEMIEYSGETAFIKKYAAEYEIGMMADMYDEEADDLQETIRMYEKSRTYYDGLLKALPELIKLTDDGIAQLEAFK
ncbi:MAG: DUF115 domain-containing protein [Clostridium sp.]|nr:DUF115 domain-containing protein [Clostridium sp.]MCM1458765.1 DUF115 domain-containing protein [Bacteroides sp.]